MRTAKEMREAQRAYQAAYRQRIKDTGRKPVTVYVTAANADKVKKFAERLNTTKTTRPAAKRR